MLEKSRIIQIQYWIDIQICELYSFSKTIYKNFISIFFEVLREKQSKSFLMTNPVTVVILSVQISQKIKTLSNFSNSMVMSKLFRS